MRLHARHWVLALSMALAAHGALVFLLEPKSAGPLQVFRSIEVALRPAERPPRTTEEVREVPEPDTVDTSSPPQTEIRSIPPPEVATLEPEAIEPVEQRDTPRAIVQTRPPAEEIRARDITLPAAPTPQAPTRPAPAIPRSTLGHARESAAAQTPGATKGYLSAVRGWLETQKRYPRAARLRRQEGTVLLRFTLDRKGQLVSYQIEQTSGFPLLDQAVEELIQRASPFPAMPSEMQKEQVEFIVPVSFSLR